MSSAEIRPSVGPPFRRVLEVASPDTIHWPKDKQPPHGTLIYSTRSLFIAHPTLASGVIHNQQCWDPTSAHCKLVSIIEYNIRHEGSTSMLYLSKKFHIFVHSYLFIYSFTYSFIILPVGQYRPVFIINTNGNVDKYAVLNGS